MSIEHSQFSKVFVIPMNALREELKISIFPIRHTSSWQLA